MRQVRLNKPKWGGRLVEGIMEKDLESVEEVYRLIKSLKVEEKRENRPESWCPLRITGTPPSLRKKLQNVCLSESHGIML